MNKEVTATNILCLMNMVTAEELIDDEDYDGIFFFIMFVHKPKKI